MKQGNQEFKIQLHVHPYFESYSLAHVINTAKKKNLDVLALEALNREIFPELVEKSKKLPSRYNVEYDGSAIQIFDKTDGKKLYLPKAIELNTKQNSHLIVIGSSKVKPNSDIEETIEGALENDCLVIFDHPFVDNKNMRKDANKEKGAEIERICKRYSGNICLEWNAYCIPWVRKLLGGGDVNKKVEWLSTRLTEQGYNVPVITDVDVHARYKWSLNEIDKACLKTKEINGDSGKAMITSLKNSIKAGNYKTDKSYVSLEHFFFNLGLPIVFHKFYKKPRA